MSERELRGFYVIQYHLCELFLICLSLTEARPFDGYRIAGPYYQGFNRIRWARVSM